MKNSKKNLLILLEHTLSKNIIPSKGIVIYEKRSFNIQDRISNELVRERYVLNIKRCSTIYVESIDTKQENSVVSMGIFPHSFIIKDINGKFLSSDFSKKLINVQIEELIEHNYLVNLNTLNDGTES